MEIDVLMSPSLTLLDLQVTLKHRVIHVPQFVEVEVVEYVDIVQETTVERVVDEVLSMSLFPPLHRLYLSAYHAPTHRANASTDRRGPESDHADGGRGGGGGEEI
jgi:hypothetical protein